MKEMQLGTVALLVATLTGACVTEGRWDNAEALAADSVEVQIDDSGRPIEVEYHVAPDAVPAVVHESMDQLHPGGRAVAAEKEYVGSTLYWELTKEIGGREVEAMFHPDGRLHSEEVEVAQAGVPDVVQKAALARLDGQITKLEEIRGSERQLLEYHAKITADGMKYKVRVTADGTVLGVVREVPAEIEVPLRR